MLAFWIGGCAADPDPAAKVERVNHALINAAVVTIHPVRINGARPPDGTLEAAVDRIRPFLRGELRIAPFADSKQIIPATLPANETLNVRNRDIAPSPSEIILAYVPAAPGVERGLSTLFDDGHQQILFSVAGIVRMKGLFFSERDAWILVQTHELGHILGVPADAGHSWHDGHCTNPRCVMYPRMDWCAVFAAVFALGPPRDFCDRCKSELKAAWAER